MDAAGVKQKTKYEPWIKTLATKIQQQGYEWPIYVYEKFRSTKNDLATIKVCHLWTRLVVN